VVSAHLFGILVILVSFVGPMTGSPEYFSCLSSVPPGIFSDFAPRQITTVFFHNHHNTSFAVTLQLDDLCGGLMVHFNYRGYIPSREI